MGIETILGVGGSLVGGLMQSDSASDAADAQSAASAAGIAEQRRQFDLVRGDTATARGVGESALLRYARELGIPYGGSAGATGAPSAGGMSEAELRSQLLPAYSSGGTPGYMRNIGPEGAEQWTPGTAGTVDEAGLMAAIRARMGGQPGAAGNLEMQPWAQEQIDPTKEPGYQFGMEQGQTALDRKIAAMGGRVSGAALKASSRYNQDYATQGYQAAYNRINSARSERMNRLAALAGMGQTAASTSGDAGRGTSNAITQLLSNQGDNAGAARLAQGNIWGNAANQIAAQFKPAQPSYINPMTGYGYGLGANYDK